jgi:hypothetical protein
MISYRESKINEKIKLIERSSTQRENQLRRKAEEREIKIRAMKEESQLRNVYFSIQKSRVVEEENRRMSVLKRQLAIHTQDDPKYHASVISSGSKQSTRASALKQSPTVLDLNRSPALHKPLPAIPLH